MARTSNKRRSRSKSGPTRARLTPVLLVLGGVVVLLTLWVAFRKPPRVPPGDQSDSQVEEVLRRARPLVEKGEYAPAVSLMEAHLRGNPDDVSVRPLLSEALMGLGRHDEAERIIDEVIRRAPRVGRALWIKGRLVARRGGDNPMSYFRHAAESPDSSAEIWAGYGLKLLLDGRYEVAEEYLLRAQTAGLEDHRTLGPLGELALRRKAFAKAEDLLTRALETDRANERLWAMLADAQKNGGELEKAVKTLTEALTAVEESAVLRMQMGEVLLQLDRPETAASAFAQAAESGSLGGQAALRAAQCYHLIARHRLATKYIEQAAALRRDDPEVELWKKKIADEMPGAATSSAPAQAP